MRRLTSLDLPLPGFEVVTLRKATLLSEPVAVVVASLPELLAVLQGHADRLQGVVITPGAEVGLARLAPLAWHATVPMAEIGSLARLVPGWLDAIGTADEALQQVGETRFRTERLSRELESTRVGYNDLTCRLREQVQDLLAAKTELSALNETLESRIARRTAQLETANAELSKALHDLMQAQAELVRAAQLSGLGTLVAGIAHELNTPIGNGLTIATTLADEARRMRRQLRDGSLTRGALETFFGSTADITVVMERNLGRAAEIIGHFKQMVVDQVGEHRRDFKLSDVVADTLSAMSPQLRKRPYRVTTEIDENLLMDSYPGAMSQILTNLVANALIHAFEGRDEGTVTLRAAALDGDKVGLSFCDDGCGIAPKDLEHVFEPFYTTKFGQGGSGLGLYIVYNQVHKLLGGHLELRSTVGVGTCFHMVLPRVAPVLTGEREPAPTPH